MEESGRQRIVRQPSAASCYLHRVAVFGWPVSQLYFHSKVLFTSTSAGEEIEVTSWLVSADDFSSRVARGANERVSAANE